MKKQKHHLEISCQHCKRKGDSVMGCMSSQQLDIVSGQKSCVLCRKKQVLFYEGGRPLGVYCINYGVVKVYKTGNAGKEQILDVKSGGQMIGYESIIVDETYSYTAETTEDSAVCFIPRNVFLESFNSQSIFSETLLKGIYKEFSDMSQHLVDQSQKSVMARLSLTLLKLREVFKTSKIIEQDETKVEINLSREDLANMVGTANETLIRHLKELKDEFIIEINRRKIKILKPEKLAQYSKF